MRKIINSPEVFVDEVMDGIFAAHPDKVAPASADRRTLVRADGSRQGRVGIVTGGGSGHLPFFLGYVGKGLASGVAIGNVFSSPSAEQIHAASVASDGGAGVLYLYGNYGGDVYNFDLAADLCAAQGISTKTVLGTDDILSAPPGKESTRRGVAGLIFAYKTAGAAAERLMDLDTVAAVAQRTVDRTRTIGVGLSPTILPAAGEPTFELDEGEMEIGIGIHGEPGAHRGPLENADAITDRFLKEISAELDLAEGAEVAVLVNGLGATPLEELYLIYRRVHEVLQNRGVAIRQRFIGEYATSLEMAGASLSICLLDPELAELMDAPAESPFFRHGVTEAAEATDSAMVTGVGEHKVALTSEAPIRTTGTPSVLRRTLLTVLPAMEQYTEELRDLDAAVGDGDLGITVGSGAQAICEKLNQLPEDADAQSILRTAGAAFASANPSTFAALVGSGVLAAAEIMNETDDIDAATAAQLGKAVLERIQSRGGASLGDKTLLDILHPAIEAAQGKADGVTAANAAAEAATAALAETAAMQSQRGRAAWVGERTRGKLDPGSAAITYFLRELHLALAAQTN